MSYVCYLSNNKLVRSSFCSFLLDLEIFLSSSDETSSSGGDESDLLSARGESGDGGRVTDMLLVTTTMGMVDGVHSNTSNSGPCSSSLRFPLVVGVTSLANGLVGSATSGDDSNHGSAVSWNGSSCATGKSNSGLLKIVGVTDDDGGGA